MSADGVTTELRNGVRLPLLGLGTSHNGGYCHDTVIYALKDCKYRLIDTAKRYGCEEFLGRAIKESGVPREEIFLITKLWPTGYGYQNAIENFHGSMKRLGVDYLDMYLMHWPLCRSDERRTKEILEETWRALEKIYDSGSCRAIGISNYYIDDLEDLLNTSSVTPHVNQIEFHPYQNNYELRKFCKDHEINIQGYSPLAKGTILSKKPVLEIASQYNKTPSQILIKWSMQNGVITIPKSTKKERVFENCQVYDFTLNPSCMAILDALPMLAPTVDGDLVRKECTEELFSSLQL